MRGDALLAKGHDTNYSLAARDTYYEMAGSYYSYSWLADKERIRQADEGRAAIAPALQREHEQRSAKLEARQEELVESARQMERSMQKTDEESKSFEEEADSLEAELDF